MEYIIYLLLYLGFTCAFVPPNYLWPLGGDSFTYDVVHDEIGIFPDFTDCFLVGPKQPNLSYTSLYFDRKNITHVDVRIPKDDTIVDFAMTLFINPQNASGIIFHYKADNQSTGNANVKNMFMYINNGQLVTSMYHLGILIESFPSGAPYSIPTNQWTMLAVANDYTTKKAFVYANELKESNMHGYDFNLELPGTLRFGDGQQPVLPSGSFHGYITAAALYNTSDGIGNVSNLVENAMKSNWRKFPVLPVCPDRVQNNVVIKHIWTLDEKGLTFDIKTNTDIENSQCFRFGPNNSSLPNRAIHIDGSPLSYIILIINGSEIDETFTLTMGVLILSQSSGSLMKIIDTQEQTIFEVVISDRNIELNAFSSTNTNCASLSMTGVFTPNTWYVVGILRDVGANSVGIVIDGNVSNTSDTCGTFGLSGELFLHIGGSNRQLPGYRGDVRCLIMFEDSGSDIMTAFHDECTNADSNVIGQVNNCTLENLRSRYHYLFKSDEVPPSSLSPIATYTSRHLSECAINCYEHLFCRSFTYIGSQCAVYDFVTEFGLAAATGASYYVVDNII